MMKQNAQRRLGSAAVLLAIAVLPSQLAAKAVKAAHATSTARKVVLIDFVSTVVDPASAAALGNADWARDAVSNVAGSMTSAFGGTGGGSAGALDQTPASYPISPALPAAALPNPFTIRAVRFAPAMVLPASYAGGSCAAPPYQPDYSRGRGVEDRRRMFYPLVYQAACEQGVPVGLFDSLVMQESGYKYGAVSRKGATGLTQLMPGTARQLGANPYVIMENLRGGARYLRQQIDRFGRYDLALAAYNAGPERVARFGRVPTIPETVGYVRSISANWAHPGMARVAAVTPATGRRAQMIFMSYVEKANYGTR